MKPQEHTRTQSLILLLISFLALSGTSCSNQSSEPVHTAEDGNFLKEGRSEYFIGTNLWYAGRLAADENGKERLERELDTLKSMGLTNLRVLATEGEDLECLEYALDRMQERGMSAVLFLNNAWEWSYGFADYLEAAGAGKQPRPATEGYQAYMKGMAAFSTNEKARELNHEYIRNIVSTLKDHPAIFSWQICNEPRCFSDLPEVRDAFVEYIHSTAALIKSIDPVHMVSTGNEGLMGCEQDMSLYERVNTCDDIDYITIHIWPYNWSWVREDSVNDGMEEAIVKIGRYIDDHLELAVRLGKPLVIEEFGYPRDGFSFDRSCTTSGRDNIYSYVFSRVVESAQNGGNLAGCNFWGWGGFAEPAHERWQEGDDLCGDPAQEPQGLNSVFATDSSTLEVITTATRKLSEMTRLRYEFSSGCLFTEEGEERNLSIEAVNPNGNATTVNLALISDLSLMSETKDTVLFKSISFSDTCTTLDFPLEDVQPGFYQVNLSWNSEGQSGSYGTFNIGIDPEQIVSPQDKRPDFDEFWSSTLSQLASTPMEITKEFSPEHSDSLRNSYRVEITSFNGEKMGGILCEPVKEGKYPVYIDYMGYGSDPYWYDPSAVPDAIEFLVSVRGQGIDRKSLFEMLSYFDIKNFTDRIECPVYMAFGLQDPVCPPHTNFAEYNMIKSGKDYFCVPTCGHAMWKEETWQEKRSAWFNSLLENELSRSETSGNMLKPGCSISPCYFLKCFCFAKKLKI